MTFTQNLLSISQGSKFRFNASDMSATLSSSDDVKSNVQSDALFVGEQNVVGVNVCQLWHRRLTQQRVRLLEGVVVVVIVRVVARRVTIMMRRLVDVTARHRGREVARTTLVHLVEVAVWPRFG